MRLNRIRKRVKGVTLVEVMMVLGVMALILALAMTLYAQVRSGMIASATVSEISMIYNIADNLDTKGNLYCCNAEEIYSSGDLPKKYYDPTNKVMITPSGGLIDPHADAPHQFLIWIRGIDSKTCVALAMTDWGTGRVNMNINGVGDLGQGQPNAQMAGSMCGAIATSKGFMAIGWQFDLE